MVAFYPHFVSCGEKATLRDVVGEFIKLNVVKLTNKSALHMSFTVCVSLTY
jgi:hypothetical protein